MKVPIRTTHKPQLPTAVCLQPDSDNLQVEVTMPTCEVTESGWNTIHHQYKLHWEVPAWLQVMLHIIVCECASWYMNNTTCASEVFVHMQHMHLCMLNRYMSYCIHMHSSYWWYRPCVSVPLCHSLQNNNRLRRVSCALKLIKYDNSYANCLFSAVSCAEVHSGTEKEY